MHQVDNEARSGAVGKTSTGSGSTVPSSGSADPTKGVSADQRRQMIAEAAYRRYEQRGGIPGEPLNDWLEAEKEVDRSLTEQNTTHSQPVADATKGAFLRALATMLSECQAQLEDLTVKAKATNTVLLREFEKQRTVAKVKCEAARAKFVQIREHTDGAWGHLKEGAEKATQEMTTAVRELASLFR